MLAPLQRLGSVLSAACVAIAMILALPVTTGAFDPAHLTPEQYLAHKPNELGRVPVFMYHNIIPDDAPRAPGMDPFMYRTYDEFWNDMFWLYEHDFYLVGMNDLISGTLDVPAGKHPVVFTFDDTTSIQFSVTVSESGELAVDPNCAVGIMERFYAEHPDFGRGAHFGMVPGNKFSWPANDQDDYFDWKVQWLIDNGYELGNHTTSHRNLLEADDEHFRWTISDPISWADSVMGAEHPLNASRVLTLPFGIGPSETIQPDKLKMLREGFTYEGQQFHLTGVLELAGGSSEVPWSLEWDPYSIPRLPVQDDVVELFREVHLEGENPYYTSDGNVDTVTVPWPLPKAQWGKLNVNAITGAGKTLVKYNPGNGHVIKHATQVMPPGTGRAWRQEIDAVREC